MMLEGMVSHDVFRFQVEEIELKITFYLWMCVCVGVGVRSMWLYKWRAAAAIIYPNLILVACTLFMLINWMKIQT